MNTPRSFKELTGLSSDEICHLWREICHTRPIGSYRKLYRPLWYRIQCQEHKCELERKYVTRLSKYANAPEEYIKAFEN